MYTEFFMDLAPESQSVGVTPNERQLLLPFYVCNCGRFFARSKYFTRRQDPSFAYLLLVTTNGVGELTYGENTCLLEKGSAVIIDCAKPHEYATKGECWEFFYAHFNGNGLPLYHDLLANVLTPIKLSNARETEDFIRELYRLSYHADEYTYIQQSDIISRILTEMVGALHTSRHNEKAGANKCVRALQEYIRRNHKENLRLDDFVGFVNLSKYYLIHLFEKETGTTPYRYLHLCRMEKAQILLHSTDLTVTEIAYEVGYDDPTLFIRRFRSLVGVTPKTYRKG